MKDYLGDGLYVEDDGYMIRLWAKRDGITHWVGLEDEVIEALFRFLERSRKLKITATRHEETGGEDAT